MWGRGRLAAYVRLQCRPLTRGQQPTTKVFPVRAHPRRPAPVMAMILNSSMTGNRRTSSSRVAQLQSTLDGHRRSSFAVRRGYLQHSGGRGHRVEASLARASPALPGRVGSRCTSHRAVKAGSPSARLASVTSARPHAAIADRAGAAPAYRGPLLSVPSGLIHATEPRRPDGPNVDHRSCSVRPAVPSVVIVGSPCSTTLTLSRATTVQCDKRRSRPCRVTSAAPSRRRPGADSTVGRAGSPLAPRDGHGDFMVDPDAVVRASPPSAAQPPQYAAPALHRRVDQLWSWPLEPVSRITLR